MSKSNKTARHELEMFYGKGCMFKKARIAERLLHSGIKIKGYKVFVGEKRYKSKKIKRLEENMTYHHLQHEADGGKTDIENGSIVSELAHRYLHSLPREQEEIINNMLREYKRSIDINGGILVPTQHGLDIQQPFQLSLDFEINEDDCIIIPVYDNTKEDRDRKFNRAKVKQETLQLINEELYELKSAREESMDNER